VPKDKKDSLAPSEKRARRTRWQDPATRKEGHFGVASKKENGVKNVIVTSNGQCLARLSPTSHPLSEASHRHEIAEKETAPAPPTTHQQGLSAQGDEVAKP
jgi:hypothetical protein